LIQIQSASLAFGGQTILDDVSWSIGLGKRIGLVGPNGAGKTTLLRVIARTQNLDSGTVSRGGLDVGYLEQDFQEAGSARSVVDEAMRAFGVVLDAIQREHEITNRLEALDDHDTPEYRRLLHELDDVHVKLAASESHLIRPRTETVLSGLGFEAGEMERPMSTFSGGWRMRVALARLLLSQPDVLLLDEPTNHLDIDSIAWLEGYLKSYPGTVVIVSHDRYFLDRMVTTTVEILRGKIIEFAGNYSFYLEDRVERRALQAAAFENQQREIEQTERFVQRFRAKATKARQVQSRIKALDRLERLPPPPTDEASISIRFPEPRRSGKVVLELSVFSKAYVTGEGRVEVFADAGPLSIERGDKIALIGRNGAGKSTLARIVNGSEPFDGSRTLGHNVDMTYFAQHQAESLNPRHTILDALNEVSQGHTETEIRSLLGAFLFSGDDVFKRIAVLSGGERSRVALAKALLVPANFLILDEPTNHLDIQSVNVLIEALRQYTGSFLVVSHDRHFLDRVTNRVWRVDHGAVRQFTGNYSDHLWQMQHGTAATLPDRAEPAMTASKPGEAPRRGGKKTREQKRREAEERNAVSRTPLPSVENLGDLDGLSEYQLKQIYNKVEQKIFQTERKQRALEKSFNDPELYANLDLARSRNDEYEGIKAKLADLYAKWEALTERIQSA
jgi:ATP-binding cassette subfamily F protein 3